MLLKILKEKSFKEITEIYCGIPRPVDNAKQREWTKYVASLSSNPKTAVKLSRR